MANPYNETEQRIKQLNEISKLVRSTYVKTRLASNRDWAKWSNAIRKYMQALRMPDILSDSYEPPIEDTPESNLFNARDTLLCSFILSTVDQDYHHLLQDQCTAKD